MTLDVARRFRDFFREHKVRATVPLGVGGPNGDRYFVRTKDRDFNSIAEYNAWVKEEEQKFFDWCRHNGIGVDRRSPLERMIDEACGYDGVK